MFLHTMMYVTGFKTTKESHSELIKSPGPLVQVALGGISLICTERATITVGIVFTASVSSGNKNPGSMTSAPRVHLLEGRGGSHRCIWEVRGREGMLGRKPAEICDVKRLMCFKTCWCPVFFSPPLFLFHPPTYNILRKSRTFTPAS